MPGFGLHPEASVDLEEIWEYIAAGSLEAADRVLEEIAKAIGRLVAFPHQGYKRPNSYLSPAAVQTGSGVCNRSRSGQKSVVGCGNLPRAQEPPRDRRDAAGRNNNQRTRQGFLLSKDQLGMR